MLNSTAQLAKNAFIVDICGDEIGKSNNEQDSATGVTFSKKSSDT